MELYQGDVRSWAFLPLDYMDNQKYNILWERTLVKFREGTFNTKIVLVFNVHMYSYFFFLFLLAMPEECRISWARDRTCATAVTTLGPSPTEPPGISTRLFLEEHFQYCVC